jgi:4-hydroxy-tetrahydrodipicolinate synthase
MAHTGHETFRDMVELSEHAGEVGIEFGIVINPYYPPAMPEELVLAWFERLCAATDQPVFLFNTVFSGSTLAPSTIAELADLDNICGIKNPRDHEHLLEVQRLVGDRIVVTDASEKDWLDLHLHHGFQSLMSTPALAMYQTPGSRPIAEYTALADNGDIEAAWKLQGTLAEHRKAFRRWLRDPWTERRIVPIAHLKAWLEMVGLPQGPVRPPLTGISGEERAALREDLRRLDLV